MFLYLFSCCSLCFAQRVDVWDTANEIRVGTELTGSLSHKVSSMTETVWSLSYGRFADNGVGGRIALAHASEFNTIKDYWAMPLRFAWRTPDPERRRELSFSEPDDPHTTDPAFYHPMQDFFVDLLSFFISRGEFFAGITPGYLRGTDNIHDVFVPAVAYGQNVEEHYREGVQSRHHFTLSVDAGIEVSWIIWRLNIGISPAIHYFLTDNFRRYSTHYKEPVSSPVRLHGSVSLNVGFLF